MFNKKSIGLIGILLGGIILSKILMGDNPLVQTLLFFSILIVLLILYNFFKYRRRSS